MLLALTTFLAGQIDRCNKIEINVGQRIAASIPLKAVCVLTDASSTGRGITLDAEVSGLDAPLCLLVETLADSRVVADSCGENGHIRLLLPQHIASPLIVYPSTKWGVPTHMRLGAYPSAMSARSSNPSPPASIERGSQFVVPQALLRSPGDNVNCAKIDASPYAFAIDYCQKDVEAYCSYAQSEIAKLKCLEENPEFETEQCREAMQYVEECRNEPPSRLLWPMTIASILLLATASMVLLCTVLRCCCRYVCGVVGAHHADDASTIHDEELTDEDETPGSVTPLPAGVKMMESTQAEPAADDDELPAYTEVVQGASITRNAASKSAFSKEIPSKGGSSKDASGRDTSLKDASAKDHYRPDVQLS